MKIPIWSKVLSKVNLIKLKLEERRLKKAGLKEKAWLKAENDKQIKQSELDKQSKPEQLERLKKINETKEIATGWKVLGPPDKRFLYAKIVGVALALLLAAGITREGVTRYNRLMVERHEAEQAKVLSNFEQQKRAHEAVLRKAGVKDVEFWQEMMARSQYWKEKFPSIPEFSREDYVELEKWFGSDYYAVNTLLPIFKHAQTFSNNPTREDLERERELFKQKFKEYRENKLAEKPSDYFLIAGSFSRAEKALEYLIKNNGNPKFRELLKKMAEYSRFDQSPFDADYTRDADPELFKKIYLGEKPVKPGFKVDQQLVDHLQTELRILKEKYEQLKNKQEKTINKQKQNNKTK